MKKLIVHTVNITHVRLVELAKLADQAKPFYDWIERKSKILTSSHKTFNEIMLEADKGTIRSIIRSCYEDAGENKPFLFDGAGRVYSHKKACFYFWAWIIRDAPQQRLAPLISKMTKADNVTHLDAELDTLAELIFEYRYNVKSFEWNCVREVVIDRLEGSRRSISGHLQEAALRSGLVTAFQSYYSAHMNYGNYQHVEIADKQIKIGLHTVDLSVSMKDIRTGKIKNIYIPVKSRETEGGGHAHIFSRDITAAVHDIKEQDADCSVAVIIIAENWSVNEIEAIEDKIDVVFHFDINPNEFVGFDDETQIKLNKYIEGVLDA